MAGLSAREQSTSSDLTRNARSSSRQHSETPSSLLGSGSDKENRGRSSVSLGKRKAQSSRMGSTRPQNGSDKRQRNNDGRSKSTRQSSESRTPGGKTDRDFYDPEQDEGTKRETSKALRDLNVRFADSRNEYLQSGSRGIQNTLKEADNLMKNVKQTSVALLDSRLLVNVGDLAYKKVNRLALGDSSTGIDVDDFLSKCILYMRNGPAASVQSSATQRRRPQRSASDDGVDEEEASMELNWAHLGSTLCHPLSHRPCLSSFLLGPLSLQKKIRAPSQRRATQRRILDPTKATRPEEVDLAVKDKQETANLTETCRSIAVLLARTQQEREARAEEEVDVLDHEPEEPELHAILQKHELADNAQIGLFDFCVDPQSFGQTVENFFYVSFLVKEGKVGIDLDSRGMPTLGVTQEIGSAQRQTGELQRNQAVFTLDFDTYEELVRSCNIKKSIIPHRDEGAYDDGTVLYERERGHDPVEDENKDEDEDMYGSGLMP